MSAQGKAEVPPAPVADIADPSSATASPAPRAIETDAEILDATVESIMNQCPSAGADAPTWLLYRQRVRWMIENAIYRSKLNDARRAAK